MAESHTRTLICSVLFIDIVEYSRKPVVEQIALKDRFNELLSNALRAVAVNDRIILDTGDGAAISFIGDPEDALFVATDLREAIAKETDPIDLELATRMGINLGPVRLVKDINGQPNIIGDGINVAQRVMSFAKPSQVLVSRSYYEIVSRLSEESSKLFTYEGSRTDKHIREHEVYGVGDVSALPRRTQNKGLTGALDNALGRHVGAVSIAAKSAIDRVAAKPRVATVVAVTAILGVAIIGRMLRAGPEEMNVLPVEIARLAEAQPAPPVAPRVAADAPPQRVPAEMPSPPQRTAAERKSSPRPARTPKPAADAASTGVPQLAQAKRAAVALVTDSKAAPAERTEKAAPVTQAAEGEAAKVTLAISPWGQVFVNGKMRGVSPPLQELELAPGKYRIEVKNTGSATHVVSVNAKPGERLRIKHKFK
ncbi:MAG TPA: adenylate/guanylate cyclase domain-containing protein [Burkholderiales bacterium]